LGQYMGGPMYYMNKACKNKWLGTAFCILCLISSFGIGNMVQSNTVSQSINSIFSRLKIYIDIKPIIIIIALIVGYITLGGIKRIAKATQAIVPAMALFYIFGCIFIIIINIKDLPYAFSYIIKSAFNIKSAGGGVCGFAISKAIKVGFTRGVFTNEAGLGSAPIAHAAAQTDHPARQGLWGIFEVFFDTIIMCTLTGLVIVISKSYDCGLAGADMTFFAFGKYLGDFAYFFIAISTIFFAVSTIIGWGYYGQTCIRFLSKSKAAMLSYKLIYIIVIYIGAVIEADLVWGLSDLFNSLMMIPNLFAILMLADEVKNITKDFEHKIKKKEL
ncbi:MAG: amino acid carrier protein, partial [Oscillospiraceae bacterium]